MRCPQCHSDAVFGPSEDGDMICLACGYVFDQDEDDNLYFVRGKLVDEAPEM